MWVEAHRLLYHSTLGSIVLKKKKVPEGGDMGVAQGYLAYRS